MLNIHFNNTSYNISEAALNAASERIKTHLSTVMNGSGATINLGGTSYGVDSTKLSAATNSFISHLGTIAGGSDTLYWNGNNGEYLTIDTEALGLMVKISDVILSADDCANGGHVTRVWSDGTIQESSRVFYFEPAPGAAMVGEWMMSISEEAVGADLNGNGSLIFPESGLWVPRVVEQYTFQINGYTGFPSSDNSGSKLTVNGVEYSIDPEKVASAVADLETVLGGLHDPDVDIVIVLDEAILDEHILG